MLEGELGDVASPLKLPVSRSGLPYRGSDDEVLFILSGSEDGQPDLSQSRVQQSERENAKVAYQFSHCCMEVNVKGMRHHAAAHLLYDTALLPFTWRSASVPLRLLWSVRRCSVHYCIYDGGWLHNRVEEGPAFWGLQARW